MPPKVALILCLLFIVFIIYISDRKRENNISWALLIPLIWMCVIGSRNISFYFPVKGINTPADYLEGSPIDRLFFGVLIIIGVIILLKRNISWRSAINQNIWISLLFLYCGVSILWSDFPSISFKRFVKDIGNIIMVLIVVTDQKSEDALNLLLKRFGYILLPLSITFYKYFPEIGRGYDGFTGKLIVTGAAINKNALGALCLVSLIFLIWKSYFKPKEEIIYSKETEYYINWIMIIMAIWLLVSSDSSTADVCLIIGLVLIMCFELRIFKANVYALKKAMYVCLLFVGFFIVINYQVIHTIVTLTGHQLTFWDRVSLWPELIKLSSGSVLLGTGYDCYWLGERMEILWNKYWWHPTEAHNGYVEIFLELGVIGLILYCIFFVTCFNKIFKRIAGGDKNAILQLAFFIVVLFYNITESAFKGLHLMWYVLLLVTIVYKHGENRNVFKKKIL